MRLRYHYFIFSLCRRKCLLDTSCLSPETKGLLPSPGSVLSHPDDTDTAGCCCPHLVSAPSGVTRPGWGCLIKCAFLKSGTEPAEMLKPGQLRERRKSSLAIGPERPRTWHREGPAASAHRGPGRQRGSWDWSGSWVTAGMSADGAVSRPIFELCEPKSFFSFSFHDFTV